MRVIYHRRIHSDLRDALSYYDGEGGKKLGNRFFAEVERTAARVIENPQGYHHFVANGLRRAQLDVFPYHFIFEEDVTKVRFLVLRHDKRHPSFGLRRR